MFEKHFLGPLRWRTPGRQLGDLPRLESDVLPCSVCGQKEKAGASFPLPPDPQYLLASSFSAFQKRLVAPSSPLISSSTCLTVACSKSVAFLQTSLMAS